MIEDAVSLQNILLIAFSFAMGGILKGAIGAGAPLMAIPVLALLFDVPTAITLFAVPSLIPNLWQIWHYRQDSLPAKFNRRLIVAGAIGAALGTVVLANVQADYLMPVVAGVVLVYVVFRLGKPGWVLGYDMAERWVGPVGMVAGFMQALGGISAPVSITFLSAMGLERRTFIVTISCLFVAMGALQLPLLIYFGFMTWHLFWLSCCALVVLFAFMPVGAFLARRISRAAFDKLVLVLLCALALRMLAPFVMGLVG